MEMQPVPKTSAAFKVYIRAALMVTPAVFVWWFSGVFILPKLLQLWELAGLKNHHAIQWLMDGTLLLIRHFELVEVAVLLLLIALEFIWKAWPRYRGVAITALALAFQTTILLGVTAAACAILCAAPMMYQKGKKEGTAGAVSPIKNAVPASSEAKNPQK